MSSTKRMAARYSGKCAGCGATISVGTQIDFHGPGQVTHTYCQASTRWAAAQPRRVNRSIDSVTGHRPLRHPWADTDEA